MAASPAPAGEREDAPGRPPALLGVVALLLLGTHALLSVRPALFTIRSDFGNYFAAARAVSEGAPLHRLYERDFFQVRLRRVGLSGLGSFVPHPPADALLLRPLSGLSPSAAKCSWTLLLVFSLALAFLVLRPLLAAPASLVAIVFLLPSAALANALAYGQPYPILLLLLCLSLAAAVRGRDGIAGALIAPVLVLKLYGLPFLLHFLWTRRGRALAGLALAGTLLVMGSMAALGIGMHQVYVREVLPRSLMGEVQDPYSPIWGSATSLAHRLFMREPDLNPEPLADAPWLGQALARGLPLGIVLAGVVAASALRAETRRQWAVLTLITLGASPLTATYHFVLLVLPAAILVAEAWRRGERGRLVLLLALLAFATSPAPHYFARFASGWGNLLAYPRLVSVLVLLGLAIGRAAAPRALLAATLGILAGALMVPSWQEEPWARVEAARGYLMAEPVACGGGLAWVTIGADRLVVRLPDGGRLERNGDAVAPRCEQGQVVSSAPGQGCDPVLTDCASGAVFVDGAGVLRLRDKDGGGTRRLATGLIRWPRLSPDGRWVVYQVWQAGSWDVRVVERATGRTVRVTGDRANEVEPAWLPEGDGIVFASDRRRGLGSTALYQVPLRP